MEKDEKLLVGIWGAGVVGKATGHVFEVLCPNKVDVLYYDKFKSEYNKEQHKQRVLELSDFLFLCLPTPMKVTGEISLEYIEASLKEITNHYRSRIDSGGRQEPEPIIIIRSTSVSGSTDKFAEMYPDFRFAFMPEFLTEKNAMLDTITTNRVVIGTNYAQIYTALKDLFYRAYADKVAYIPLSMKEAETLKYFSNIFRFMQIMTSNDLYFFCQKIGVNYKKVVDILKLDSVIGSFTQVPGHDGDFGAGGKCLVKDANAFLFLAKQNEYPLSLVDIALQLNDHVRRNHDWLEIPGAHEDCIFEKGKA